MNERIWRWVDIADYALCRFGPLSFPTWADFESSCARKLYAGKLRRALPQFQTHYCITPFFSSTGNIPHDLTQPMPIPDGSVDVFQSEDVFEHIPIDEMPGIFNEIYRVLSPGGLFRLSLPDYNEDFHKQRSVKDAAGTILFDSYGGGRFENGQVVGGGHIWFPTIEMVRTLFDSSAFASGRLEYLHYHNADGSFEM